MIGGRYVHIFLKRRQPGACYLVSTAKVPAAGGSVGDSTDRAGGLEHGYLIWVIVICEVNM